MSMRRRAYSVPSKFSSSCAASVVLLRASAASSPSPFERFPPKNEDSLHHNPGEKRSHAPGLVRDARSSTRSATARVATAFCTTSPAPPFDTKGLRVFRVPVRSSRQKLHREAPRLLNPRSAAFVLPLRALDVRSRFQRLAMRSILLSKARDAKYLPVVTKKRRFSHLTLLAGLLPAQPRRRGHRACGRICVRAWQAWKTTTTHSASLGLVFR